MKRLKIGVIALALAILSPFSTKEGKIAKEPIRDSADVSVSGERQFTEKSQTTQKAQFTEESEAARETGFTEEPQAMEQAAGSVVMLEVYDREGKIGRAHV